MRRALFWLAFNVPLGKLTPWVIGLALGRKPIRMTQEETDRLEAKRRNAH